MVALRWRRRAGGQWREPFRADDPSNYWLPATTRGRRCRHVRRPAFPQPSTPFRGDGDTDDHEEVDGPPDDDWPSEEIRGVDMTYSSALRCWPSEYSITFIVVRGGSGMRVSFRHFRSSTSRSCANSTGGGIGSLDSDLMREANRSFPARASGNSRPATRRPSPDLATATGTELVSRPTTQRRSADPYRS